MKSPARLNDGGSLVDLAVRRVRGHIRDNDLKVGDTLPGEGQFATEIGVSRAVMREAFGTLAALRLIDVANGRRARVGAIDLSVMGTSVSPRATAATPTPPRSLPPPCATRATSTTSPATTSSSIRRWRGRAATRSSSISPDPSSR